VLPAPLFFIAKAELFRLPILGWYMRAVGMVPVDRRAGARGGLDLSQFSRAAETSGVVAFPEGTRSRDGRLGSFKRGAFSAAIAAQIPIVPIAIENAAQVVGRRGMSARPGTIRVHYGREISTVGLDQKDRAGLAEEAREEVARLLGGADADGSSAA
jgi:1-acyl-sn-glycerol-3-phosphate acyltransferase